MIEATISRILEHGKANADDSFKAIPQLKSGEFVSQGDINFICLTTIPKDAVLIPTPQQLAPGNSRGSRHCIKASDLHKVKAYRLPNPNPIQGPILEFLGEVTIEHPEHGDQLWTPCIVAVTYQRKHAEELRRVQD
jgi:hypothetical protein